MRPPPGPSHPPSPTRNYSPGPPPLKVSARPSPPPPPGSWLHHHPIWRSPTPAWNSSHTGLSGQSNSQLLSLDLRFHFFSSPEWLEPPCNSPVVNPSQTLLTVGDTSTSLLSRSSYLAFQHCAWLIQARTGGEEIKEKGCCSGSISMPATGKLAT